MTATYFERWGFSINEGGRFALVALNDGTAVPEPATAALLLLSCVPFARRRRSRR